MKILIVLAAMAGLALTGGCHSPSRSRGAPSPTYDRVESQDPLSAEVDRTDKTVLEMLWDLEKSVREKNRRIVLLEGKLEEAREMIQRLRGGEKTSNASPTDSRSNPRR